MQDGLGIQVGEALLRIRVRILEKSKFLFQMNAANSLTLKHAAKIHFKNSLRFFSQNPSNEYYGVSLPLLEPQGYLAYRILAQGYRWQGLLLHIRLKSLEKSKLLLKMNAINSLRFFSQASSNEYYEVPLPSMKPQGYLHTEMLAQGTRQERHSYVFVSGFWKNPSNEYYGVPLPPLDF